MKDLLIELGFRELFMAHFVKDAPGCLKFWTEVVIDLRWSDETIIKGIREHEVGVLFRGMVGTPEELEVLLKQTKAIES